MKQTSFLSIGRRLSALFWPTVCPFCMKPCRAGICPSCRRKLKTLTVREPVYKCCGRPIHDEQEEYCKDCRKAKDVILPGISPRVFTRGASLYLHREPVSSSLYQFKYHNQRSFAEIYARELVSACEPLIRSWQAQCLIPVPLHPKRQKMRGYNQAELLAWELGKRLQLPVVTNAVARVRYTKPQKALGGAARKENLAGAFKAYPPIRPVKRVILVDDIYTTGSTIEEVGRALLAVGVEKIYFLTVSTSWAED